MVVTSESSNACHKFGKYNGIPVLEKRKLVRKIWELEKSAVKLQCLDWERETTFGSSYREVRKTEDSRNRDFTVAGVLVPKVYTICNGKFNPFLSISIFHKKDTPVFVYQQ